MAEIHDQMRAEFMELRNKLHLDPMTYQQVLAMDPHGPTHNIYCTKRQWQLIELALSVAADFLLSVRQEELKQHAEMARNAEAARKTVSIGGFIRQCDVCGKAFNSKNSGDTCVQCLTTIIANSVDAATQVGGED